MKSLNEILFEGAFDYAAGGYDLGSTIEKDSTKNILETYGNGNYKVTFLKDGSCKIKGRLIISKYPGESLNIKCKEFNGRLTIENCPNLTSLKGGLFDNSVVFKGSLTINQCPSLESLDGIPSMIDGDLTITNCKKIKDFGSCDAVLGGVMWMNNGKKYTPEQIAQKISVVCPILCSTENIESNIEESMIDESLNNPWLQKLADQLKKYPYNDAHSWQEPNYRYTNIDDIFYNRTMGKRIYSEIDSNQVYEFDLKNADEKKEFDKILFATYNSRGNTTGMEADMILVFDKSINAFVWGVGEKCNIRGYQGQVVRYFTLPHKDKSTYSNEFIYKTEVRDKFNKLSHNEIAIVISTNTETGVNARNQMMRDRASARLGSITPGDAEQYADIAKENIRRYKQIIATNRAKKKNDKYEKLSNDVDSIMQRAFKLSNDVIKNPKKYDGQKYSLTNFFNWLRDEQRINPNYKPWKSGGGSPYYGDNGLMYCFRNFIDYYMDVFGKDESAVRTSDTEYLEKAAERLQKAIDTADAKLKQFGF